MAKLRVRHANALGALLLTLAAFGGTAGTVQAQARAQAQKQAPDLDALVRYETTQTLPSGITRIERWSEQWRRRSHHVWSQRVGSESEKGDQRGQGHKHFDFDTAARLVERDPSGVLGLRFVDPHRRLIVDVPAAEFATVGFDGRWDTTSHLVPPSLIAQLPVQTGNAPTGARWRVQKISGWTHRVLWSDRLQVALRIESTRDNGSLTRTVRFEAAGLTPAAQLPWHAIEHYQRRNYEDFLD